MTSLDGGRGSDLVLLRRMTRRAWPSGRKGRRSSAGCGWRTAWIAGCLLMPIGSAFDANCSGTCALISSSEPRFRFVTRYVQPFPGYVLADETFDGNTGCSIVAYMLDGLPKTQSRRHDGSTLPVLSIWLRVYLFHAIG